MRQKATEATMKTDSEFMIDDGTAAKAVAAGYAVKKYVLYWYRYI